MDRKLDAQTIENPTLHKTFWFWAATATPIAVAIVFGYFVHKSGAIENYSFLDLNTILNSYRVPVGIAGLAIPFVAVVAAIHRSSQTANQINVQRQQNNFINHFKHLEEFKKAFSSCDPADLLPWKSVEDLHRSIYQNSMFGDFTPASSMYQTVLTIKEYCSQHKNQKLFILDDISGLSDDIRKKIDVEDPIIRPYIMANLCEVISKSINFSALNKQPDTLSEIQQLTLNCLDKLYLEICDAIKRSDESITPLLDDIYLTEEETYERMKNMGEDDIKIIVLNALKFIAENSIENLKDTYQSLTDNAREKLNSIFDEHLSDHDNDGFKEVQEIYSICKSFE